MQRLVYEVIGICVAERNRLAKLISFSKGALMGFIFHYNNIKRGK
jgi:hypothetical protein